MGKFYTLRIELLGGDDWDDSQTNQACEYMDELGLDARVENYVRGVIETRELLCDLRVEVSES